MIRLMNKFFFSILSNHVISYPTPSNLNYFWGFGSISGILLVWQVLTGLFLAMHYIPETNLAYNSVEHIMRNVRYGWLIRYCHSGGASMLFICLYIHMARGLYFRSYRKINLWYSGLLIFILTMITAFFGYILPWGQMSLWGATVITNLFSAIPFIGSDLVVWLWGGFSVENPTLKRFFVLHCVLPFFSIILSLIHLMFLHKDGSTNPLGLCPKMDTIHFCPQFISKDIYGCITLISFFILCTVFIYPNFLGHPDNFIKADPFTTPKHIVPEWYFLPYYAILRSIPNKLGGILVMASSILILFFLPFLGDSKCRSSKFSNLYSFFFWSFVFNFIFLGWIGGCVLEEPFVLVSKFATSFYFSYFLLILPTMSYVEYKLNII